MLYDPEKTLFHQKKLSGGPITSEDITIEKIVTLLNMKPSLRNHRQVLILQSLTSHIKFFQEKSNEVGASIHYECCSKMSYELVKASNYVFEYGDKGSKFYIILEGKASVVVPMLNEITQVNKFTGVSELGSGDSFGELALIKDQTRIASILALTDLHLAVLTKNDFNSIISKAEIRRIDSMIDFFKGIPLFSQWPKKKIEKITYFFGSASFKRKQIVFEEGDQPKFVYIVRKGEFELFRRIAVQSGGNLKQSIIVKVALLGAGEMFAEEELLFNKNFAASCCCYSAEGELLRISAEHFMLKFSTKRNYLELVEDRKEKYSIREERLTNFKKILDCPKSISIPGPKVKRVRHKFIKERQKTSITDKKKSYHCFPLSPAHINSIRSKALPCSDKERIFLPASLSIKHNPKMIHSQMLSPRDLEEKSNLEMVYHRPGGYYSGKLKRRSTHKHSISSVH